MPRPLIAAPANARALDTGFPRRRQPPGGREGVASTLVMHNVVVDGHRTAVRLEPEIWGALKDIARQRKLSVHDLVSEINRQRTASGLTAAIRVYVVVYLSTVLHEALSTRLLQDRQTDPVRWRPGP